jgi:hypothetical protein
VTQGHAQHSDARLTADREEQKFLVAAAEARRLAETLGERLAPHRFRGEGANRLPGARHYLTTIYFDTAARDLYRHAAAPVNVKLRAKEYYDLHPALVEVATDSRQLARHQPMLWLELKARDHERTRKRRVAIPRREATALLARGTLGATTLALHPAARDAAGLAVIEEIAALCTRLGAEVAPACLVHYRRRAWQDEPGTLRVTLDLQLTYHAAPPALLECTTPLALDALPPPGGRESRAVLEVKGEAGVPAWLGDALASAGAVPARFSKFEAASRALHG